MKNFFDDDLNKEIKKYAILGAKYGYKIGAAVGAVYGASLFGVGAVPGALICSVIGLAGGAALGAAYPIVKKLLLKAIKKLKEKYGHENVVVVFEGEHDEHSLENANEKNHIDSVVNSVKVESEIDTVPKSRTSLRLSRQYSAFFGKSSLNLSHDNLSDLSVSDDESSESDLSSSIEIGLRKS